MSAVADPTVPAVSIVMTAFKHAKYAAEAVESALAQTFTDIEVILIDDGSRDGTAALASRVTDPRFTLLIQNNAGPSAALNRAIHTARASVIAILSADDRARPNRIATQYATLVEGGYDAVFARPVLIDEEGALLADKRFPTFFRVPAQSATPALLRTLFFEANFICASTAMIRRRVFDEAGFFNPALYQLQDFDLWLRIFQHHHVALTDDRVIDYRLRNGDGNLSTPRNYPRTHAELYWVYRRLLATIAAPAQLEAFGADLGRWHFEEAPPDDQRIALALLHNDSAVRRIGLERLLDRFASSVDEQPIPFGRLSLSPADLAQLLAVPA